MPVALRLDSGVEVKHLSAVAQGRFKPLGAAFFCLSPLMSLETFGCFIFQSHLQSNLSEAAVDYWLDGLVSRGLGIHCWTSFLGISLPFFGNVNLALISDPSLIISFWHFMEIVGE